MDGFSLFDDVVLQRRDEGEDLTLLFLRHFELIERCDEMFGSGVPLGVCNPESGVRCLHFATRVDTWSTGGGAKLIENMLANPLLGISAVADEEFFKLLIGYQSSDEVIDYGCECVVTAAAFVERFLLGLAGAELASVNSREKASPRNMAR